MADSPDSIWAVYIGTTNVQVRLQVRATSLHSRVPLLEVREDVVA